MFESLVNATALPNLHPAVVHLPIVLIPLALIFDAVGTALFGQKWIRPAATSIWTLAAFSAWFAVWAGEQAADGLTNVLPQVQPRIGEHSDWAHYTLYAVALLALARLLLHFHPRLKEVRSAYLGFVLVGAAALFPLVQAADLGGELVYKHGLGVGLSPEPSHSADADAETVAETQGSDQNSEHADHEATESVNGSPAGVPQPVVVADEDGTLTWMPKAGEGSMLSTLFTSLPGQDLSAVREVEGDEEEGLLLEVSGKATLLFAGPFSDVQVEAVLDVLDFQGEISLVHHADGVGGGFLTLSSDNVGKLVDVRDGKVNQLARETIAIPEGTFEVAVSSAGRHLKGLLNGATVLHGHIAPGPGQGAGFSFDGQGSVRVLRVSAISLGGD